MMPKHRGSSCMSALSNSDPPSDRKRAILLLAKVELAEVPPAEVLSPEVLPAEANLNSVHAVNASFADLVGIKKIQVMREYLSTKMIKNRFQPREIGRGPPMSE